MKPFCWETVNSRAIKHTYGKIDVRYAIFPADLVLFLRETYKSTQQINIEIKRGYTVWKNEKKRAKTQKKISWVFQVKNTKKRHFTFARFFSFFHTVG